MKTIATGIFILTNEASPNYEAIKVKSSTQILDFNFTSKEDGKDRILMSALQTREDTNTCILEVHILQNGHALDNEALNGFIHYKTLVKRNGKNEGVTQTFSVFCKITPN